MSHIHYSVQFSIIWKSDLDETRTLELRATDKEEMISWIDIIGRFSNDTVQDVVKPIDWWLDLFSNVKLLL